LPKLAAHDCRDIHEPLNPLALRKSFRVWHLKVLITINIVTSCMINAKRDA
jgi:hypothetical protein